MSDDDLLEELDALLTAGRALDRYYTEALGQMPTPATNGIPAWHDVHATENEHRTLVHRHRRTAMRAWRRRVVDLLDEARVGIVAEEDALAPPAK